MKHAYSQDKQTGSRLLFPLLLLVRLLLLDARVDRGLRGERRNSNDEE